MLEDAPDVAPPYTELDALLYFEFLGPTFSTPEYSESSPQPNDVPSREQQLVAELHHLEKLQRKATNFCISDRFSHFMELMRADTPTWLHCQSLLDKAIRDADLMYEVCSSKDIGSRVQE